MIMIKIMIIIIINFLSFLYKNITTSKLGVGIFGHLTIRSDSDSGSHDPIPERFLIYFFSPLLIN